MRVNVYSRGLFLPIAVSVVLLILAQPIFAWSGAEPPAASPTTTTHDSVALISPEWPAIQGDLVWEATMTVGSNGGFLENGGPLDGSITDNEFAWGGVDYTVRDIFFIHPESDPESTTVSIDVVPELPDESSGLRLVVEGLGAESCGWKR